MDKFKYKQQNQGARATPFLLGWPTVPLPYTSDLEACQLCNGSSDTNLYKYEKVLNKNSGIRDGEKRTETRC